MGQTKWLQTKEEDRGLQTDKNEGTTRGQQGGKKLEFD